MLNKGLKPVLYDKDKAVSPIIATILLVAITVILASTLYLALGGFFSHTTTAAPTVSVGATNQTTSTGQGYEYVISFGSPTSTVSLSSVVLKITFNNGTVASIGPLSSLSSSSASNPYGEGPLSAALYVNSSTTTGNLGPSVSVILQPGPFIYGSTTTKGVAFGITSIQVVDTGTNGGVMGTASIS